MKKFLLVAVAFLSLQGCATVQDDLMPGAATALEHSKDLYISLSDVQAKIEFIYGVICLPPAMEDLQDVCTELDVLLNEAAKGNVIAKDKLNLVINLYNELNEGLK